MSLQLDERRIAMLEQMGVPVLRPALTPAATPAASTAAESAATAASAVPDTAAAKAAATASSTASTAARARAQAVAASPPSAPREISLQPRPSGVEQMDWDTLRQTVAGCQACGLCATRRNTVFGVGHPRAHWMVIGEAPGENEDLQGEPFVGQAGKLLDNMLRAIGVSRHVGGGSGADGAGADAGMAGAYIANVLKCRPPANRNPEPGEMVQCEPYLKRQIALVQPRIILAMGRFAVQALLQTTEPIGRLRGREHRYEGVPLVVTYHPAYLLRNLPDKAKAWADLCLAMSLARREALSAASQRPASP